MKKVVAIGLTRITSEILKQKELHTSWITKYETIQAITKPKDYHTFIYADMLLLRISPINFEIQFEYLQKVFEMRLRTNGKQKLQLICFIETQSFDERTVLLKGMNQEMQSWFQEVVCMELQYMN